MPVCSSLTLSVFYLITNTIICLHIKANARPLTFLRVHVVIMTYPSWSSPGGGGTEINSSNGD